MKISEIKTELAELKTTLANFLTGKPSAEQLTSFQTRLAAVESAAAKFEADLSARDQSIKDLTARLDASAGQVTKLTTDLQAEKEKTSKTLASMGLPADQLPNTNPAAAPGTAAESAWQKYVNLSDKDPLAASRFYAQNADEILASRFKK